MSDNDQALLPCPFCGGEAKLYRMQDDRTGADTDEWFARCDPCDLIHDAAWGKPASEAIAAWNRRAQPATIGSHIGNGGVFDPSVSAAEPVADPFAYMLRRPDGSVFWDEDHCIWTHKEDAEEAAEEHGMTMFGVFDHPPAAEPVGLRELLDRAELAWQRFFYPAADNFSGPIGDKLPSVDLEVADCLRLVLAELGRHVVTPETDIPALTTPARTDDAAQAGGDDKWRKMLLELLAVIHRDGGHKTQAIGIQLAYEQALQLSSERIHSLPSQEVGPSRADPARAIEIARQMDAEDGGYPSQKVEPAALVKRQTVDIIREWLLSGDHPVSQWEKDFAAALDAAAYPTGAGEGLPADVVLLVVAGREAWEFLQEHQPHDQVTAALFKALERFASRVCYDDEGGDLPEAHADPCTCGAALTPADAQKGEG